MCRIKATIEEKMAREQRERVAEALRMQAQESSGAGPQRDPSQHPLVKPVGKLTRSNLRAQLSEEWSGRWGTAHLPTGRSGGNICRQALQGGRTIGVALRTPLLAAGGLLALRASATALSFTHPIFQMVLISDCVCAGLPTAYSGGNTGLSCF